MIRPEWCVFPVLPPNADGSCSCGNPTCENAGKHPAAKWGAKSLGAGEKMPIPEGYNVGLATGSRSGDLLVVDIDTKGGVDGYASLAALGPIPETLADRTPTGGGHLYFRLPKGLVIKNSVSKLGPGLDIRAEGGYVLLPPSRHKNGGRYEWVNEAAGIVDAPAWLVGHLTGKGGLPVTRDTLAKLAKTWKRAKNVYRQELGEALDRVVKGEAFAEHGARETTLWELCRAVATACPHARPEEVAELFRPSLDLQMSQGSAHGYEEALAKLERLLSPSETWTSRLLASDDGTPRACQANVCIVVECHDALRGALGFDDRAAREVWTRAAPWDEPGGELPRPVVDADSVALTVWLAEHQNMAVGREVCRYALDAEAQRRCFDPLRDELDALEWDGVSRLESFFVRYAGAQDSDYIRAAGRCFLISLAARAMDPGCKVDTMPILLGAQGIGKSTLLRVLAGERYFADSLPDIDSKDALSYLLGKWLVEVKELEAFTRKEMTTIKGFIDQRVDRYRPAYAAKEVERPRRCVFVGTTNAEDHHRDPTGARRFWTIECSKINVEGLEAERDQILAEAVERWRRGEPWWLTREEEERAAEVQEDHRERDPWEDQIERMVTDGVRQQGHTMGAQRMTAGGMLSVVAPTWVIPPGGPVTASEILHQLGVDAAHRTRAHEMRVGVIMRGLGWVRERGSAGIGRRHIYRAKP